MNPDTNKSARTNRTSVTIIVGLATLILGVVIGVAAESSASSSALRQPANAAVTQPASTATTGLIAATSGWNPFQEIRAMQRQMDQSFDGMFDQFRMDPQFNAFKINPGYSLSLDVRDLPDYYEVRAYLPDAKASDVHVKLNNGQTLSVEVSNQHTQAADRKSEATSVAEWGQYQQEVQLPAPVKADQMKIKREGHQLVITIPKAT